MNTPTWRSFYVGYATGMLVAGAITPAPEGLVFGAVGMLWLIIAGVMHHVAD